MTTTNKIIYRNCLNRYSVVLKRLPSTCFIRFVLPSYAQPLLSTHQCASYWQQVHMNVPVTDNKYIYMCQLLTTSTHACASYWQQVHMHVPVTDNKYTWMCQLLTTSTYACASYWQQVHMNVPVTDNKYTWMCQLLTTSTHVCASYWQLISNKFPTPPFLIWQCRINRSCKVLTFYYNVLFQSVFKMLPKILKFRKLQPHFDVTCDFDVTSLR